MTEKLGINEKEAAFGQKTPTTVIQAITVLFCVLFPIIVFYIFQHDFAITLNKLSQQMAARQFL